jgi:excisionase family DNA binding protein
MPTIVGARPRFIDIPEASSITSLGRTSLYSLMAKGELRRIKLGRKTVLLESEVVEWVTHRAARLEV